MQDLSVEVQTTNKNVSGEYRVPHGTIAKDVIASVFVLLAHDESDVRCARKTSADSDSICYLDRSSGLGGSNHTSWRSTVTRISRHPGIFVNKQEMSVARAWQCTQPVDPSLCASLF